MPYLKGSLHVHTTFSDGVNTLEEMAEAYTDLGFDFIAITDHDYLVRQGYWERIPESNGNLLILKGIELEYPPLDYHHINRIVGDAETLFVFNHPGQYGLSVHRVKNQIEIVSRQIPIHCLEVTEKGVYNKMYDTPRLPLPKIATDDAHSIHECGRAWVEVFCARQRDAILQAIKKGNFQIQYKDLG
jgi:hypothetical protein